MVSFKRRLSVINKKYLDLKYQHEIDEVSILKLKGPYIRELFKNEEPELKEAYLHHIVHLWFKKYYKDSEKHLTLLKKLIRKTKISLNETEKHDLIILEERVFSLDRHIKVLEVNANLGKREKAGIKFVGAKLYNQKNGLLKLIGVGDLIGTNIKFVMNLEDDKTVAFVRKRIDNYSFEEYGFKFSYEGKAYVIRIHDQKSLNNTIKNLINKS